MKALIYYHVSYSPTFSTVYFLVAKREGDDSEVYDFSQCIYKQRNYEKKNRKQIFNYAMLFFHNQGEMYHNVSIRHSPSPHSPSVSSASFA